MGVSLPRENPPLKKFSFFHHRAPLSSKKKAVRALLCSGRFERFRCVAWLLACAWLSCPSVRAGTEFNEAITAFEVKDDNLIVSDPQRAGIVVQAAVEFTAKQTFPPPSDNYRLVFGLFDQDDNPVDLEGSIKGQFGAYVTAPFAVTRSESKLVHLVLVPRAAPDRSVYHYLRFAVQEETTAGTFVSRATYEEPLVRGGKGRRYWTFANTVSADAKANILGRFDTMGAPADDQLVAIRSVPGREGFRFSLGGQLRRYDAFDEPLPEDGTRFPVTTTVNFRHTLTDVTAGTAVPLSSGGNLSQEITLDAFAVSGEGVRTPVSRNLSNTLNVVPVSPAAIYPDHTYRLDVTLEYTDPSLGTVVVGSQSLNGLRMISLSGKLIFGAVETSVTALVGNPATGMTVSPSNDEFYFGPVTIAPGGAYPVTIPARVFGGGPLNVVFSRGDGSGQGNLRVMSGSITIGGADSGSIAGVRYERGPLVLDKDGAKALEFTVFLPAGLGYAENPRTGRLKGRATQDIGLDSQLEPAGMQIRNRNGGSLWVSHDRLPYRFETDFLDWVPATGEFLVKETGTPPVYARELELEMLESVRSRLRPLPDGRPDDGTRMSNEGYLRGAAHAHALHFSTSPDGRALLDVDLKTAPPEYAAHFPRGVRMRAESATLNLRASEVAADSLVTAPAPVTFSYSRIALDAPQCVANAPGVILTADFTSKSGEWRITPDGGLRSDGGITTTDVSWGLKGNGDPTHTVLSVSAGGAHFAGHALPRSVAAGELTDDEAPYLAPAMLLTGFGSPADPGLIERPGTKGYNPALASNPAEQEQAGRADYPGLNFRVGSDGALMGRSILAGAQVGPYPIRGYAKYYLRLGGVSGVHDPVAAAILPLPKFYGYDIALDSLRLAYLDNTNVDSVITGQLDLPEPSGFKLDFKEVRFTSTGELASAELVNPGEKRLVYWDMRIRPESFEFAQADECVPGRAFITIGVSGLMPAITDQPMYSLLGFRPDGTLIAAGDVENLGPSVDSRFVLPTNLQILGAGGGVYPFVPVTKAALNAYVKDSPDPNPTPGFVSFAGNLAVPFFEDLKVHVHASPSASDSLKSQVHLMGGWTNNPADDANGWTDANGRHFFNDPNFDSTNRGYPTGVSLEDYRNYAEGGHLVARYHPAARKNWRHVVEMTYPLGWSPGRRAFEGLEGVGDSDTFLILDVAHQVHNLTTEGCSITFGAEFETPRLNVSDLSAELLEASGLTKALAGIIDIPSMAVDIDGLDKLVTDRLERLIGSALDRALDPAAGEGSVVEEVYQRLSGLYEVSGVPRSFVGLTGNQLPGDLLEEEIEKLGDPAGEVFKEIHSSLQGGIDACDEALKLVVKVNGVRGGISQAAAKLGELGQTPAAAPDLARELQAAEDALAECEAIIREVREVLVTLRDGTDIQVKLKAAIASVAGTASDAAMADIVGHFSSQQDLTGAYMEEFSPSQVKATLRGILRRSLSGRGLAAAVQPLLRGVFTEVRSQFRAGLDLAFSEINRVLNRAVSGAIVAGSSDFKALAGESGEDTDNSAGVGNFFAAARVEGYAQIDGEEIEEIRINARLQLEVSDALTVDGWFRLLNCDSDTPNTSGRDPGDVDTEVTVGAHAVAQFAGVGVDASVEGKFSFKDGALSGVDGSLDLRSKIPIKQVSLDRVALKFGFGSGEGYITGLVGATVDFVQMEGYCFFGVTRNPLALSFIDEDSRILLAPRSTTGGRLAQPLAGFYTGFDGSVSLNKFFRIPDSCFLRLHGLVGSGNFVFLEGTGAGRKAIAGIRYGVGVRGEILCIVDIEGKLGAAVKIEIPFAELPDSPSALFDTLKDAKASGTAKLRVSGTVGPCPLCKDFDKTFRLLIEMDRNDVDVSFD